MKKAIYVCVFVFIFLFACETQKSVQQPNKQPKQQTRQIENRTNVVEDMVRYMGEDSNVIYFRLTNKNRLGRADSPITLVVSWRQTSTNVAEHLTYWCKQVRFDPRLLAGDNTISDSAILEIILSNGRVVNISDLIFDDKGRYRLAREWKAN
jgi:hypothetical protein